MRGFVLASRGAYCELSMEDGGRRLATLRGKGKSSLDSKRFIVTGDEVEASPEGVDAAVIERIFPRRSLVERACPSRRERIQPLVANVDHALVVFSAARPSPRVASMDRYLVSVEFQNIEPTLAFNKWDLADGEAERLYGIFSAAGYRCLRMEALLAPEKTREAVLGLPFSRLYVCGPSGVGKTSILNAVLPSEHHGAVGAVNEQTGKGRQTTTAIELRPVDGGRFVVDTPGLSTLMLAIEPNNLKQFYREFSTPAGRCRFHSCLHTGEPDCAVREEVGKDISADRYESYLNFLDELQRDRNRARYSQKAQ